MASRTRIRVVARRLYDRNGRTLAGITRVPLTAVDPTATRLRFTALTTRERQAALRAPPGLQRHIAWLQLYAQKLHGAGLLGEGEVAVQFDPTLPSHVYAAAISEHASIQLNPRAGTSQLGRFEHESLLHELLHLGQTTGGSAIDVVLEATIQLLSHAIGVRLQPYLEYDSRYPWGLAISYPSALALPLLHWKLRSAGAERRGLLPWVLNLYSRPVAACAWVETSLGRLPRAERTLLTRTAQAHVRHLPGRALHCRQGDHGQCAHSLLPSFLLAFGHEWASYGTERDPALAQLRAGYPLPITETGYASSVARYAFICAELLRFA